MLWKVENEVGVVVGFIASRSEGSGFEYSFTTPLS